MNLHPEMAFIHQILILESEDLPGTLPPEIRRSQMAVRNLYPEARYRLWDRRALRQVIGESLPPSVLHAFDTLRPMAYQADLARYVLLYLYGGLYVDLGIVLQKRWTFPAHRKIAACRDAAFISPSWTAIQNGLLWAVPKRPEFRHAIESICRHCQTHYYGHNPLYPTGPVLLGKAFARTTLATGLGTFHSEQDIGQCLCLTPEGAMNNLAYMSRNGELIALRTKRLPGDLSHMGIKNGNNYNQLWNTRSIYDETHSDGIIQKWDASAPPLHPLRTARQTAEGITVFTPMKGRLNSGPYTTLPAGRYCLQALFDEQTRFFWLKLEIACGPRNRIIYKKRRFFWQRSKKDHSLNFPFHLPQMSENVEFRLVVKKNFRGTLRALHLMIPAMRS